MKGRFWSMKLMPGERVKVALSHAVRITNACIGPGSLSSEVDDGSQVIVKLSSTGQQENVEAVDVTKEINILTFVLDKVEHLHTEIILHNEDTYLFKVIGSREVHLSGYYCDLGPSPSAEQIIGAFAAKLERVLSDLSSSPATKHLNDELASTICQHLQPFMNSRSDPSHLASTISSAIEQTLPALAMLIKEAVTETKKRRTTKAPVSASASIASSISETPSLKRMLDGEPETQPMKRSKPELQMPPPGHISMVPGNHLPFGRPDSPSLLPSHMRAVDQKPAVVPSPSQLTPQPGPSHQSALTPARQAPQLALTPTSQPQIVPTTTQSVPSSGLASQAVQVIKPAQTHSLQSRPTSVNPSMPTGIVRKPLNLSMDGIRVQDGERGTGPLIMEHSKVTLIYMIRDVHGKTIIEAAQKNIETCQNQLLPQWEAGLSGMQQGGKRQIAFYLPRDEFGLPVRSYIYCDFLVAKVE